MAWLGLNEFILPSPPPSASPGRVSPAPATQAEEDLQVAQTKPTSGRTVIAAKRPFNPALDDPRGGPPQKKPFDYSRLGGDGRMISSFVRLQYLQGLSYGDFAVVHKGSTYVFWLD